MKYDDWEVKDVRKEGDNTWVKFGPPQEQFSADTFPLVIFMIALTRFFDNGIWGFFGWAIPCAIFIAFVPRIITYSLALAMVFAFFLG